MLLFSFRGGEDFCPGLHGESVTMMMIVDGGGGGGGGGDHIMKAFADGIGVAMYAFEVSFTYHCGGLLILLKNLSWLVESIMRS
ncbi:hypothetical protein QYF36_009871 [Acer negundo]|nr:hypothetical protein QYF36_009871 [Acer negundo]